MSQLEGRRYRDPAVDGEFVVRDAPDTTGRSTRFSDTSSFGKPRMSQ